MFQNHNRFHPGVLNRSNFVLLTNRIIDLHCTNNYRQDTGQLQHQIQHFGPYSKLKKLGSWLNRRLRMILRSGRTRRPDFATLKVWEQVSKPTNREVPEKGYWRVAKILILHNTLGNSYEETKGLRT